MKLDPKERLTAEEVINLIYLRTALTPLDPRMMQEEDIEVLDAGGGGGAGAAGASEAQFRPITPVIPR